MPFKTHYSQKTKIDFSEKLIISTLLEHGNPIILYNIYGIPYKYFSLAKSLVQMQQRN